MVKPAPEQVEALMPAQDPLAASTLPMEAEAQTVEVIDLVERRSPHLNDTPNQPRVFDDKRLEEAWRKISDCQLKTDSGTFYSKYADKAVHVNTLQPLL